jgi:hypothetical protein
VSGAEIEARDKLINAALGLAATHFRSFRLPGPYDGDEAGLYEDMLGEAAYEYVEATRPR